MYLHPTLADTDLASPRLGPEPAVTPLLLADLTDRVAGAAERWRPVLRHDPERRWFTRLLRTDTVEVWLLGWTPGQQVPAHDHGGAAGAFTVVDGALVEDQLDPGSWAPGRRTSCSTRPGPGCGGWTRGLPRPWPVTAGSWSTSARPPSARRRARSRGRSSSSGTCSSGAWIRPAPTGWPRCGATTSRSWSCARRATPSAWAAASLQDLGLRRATDLAGGFKAWAAAGLPVAAAGSGR